MGEIQVLPARIGLGHDRSRLGVEYHSQRKHHADRDRGGRNDAETPTPTGLVQFQLNGANVGDPAPSPTDRPR